MLLRLLILSSFFFSIAQAVERAGTFDIPVGASSKGPAFPGHSYEFEVMVYPNERLNFASMYGASNDWFFSLPLAFDPDAWDASITKSVTVYDAGTELDENPDHRSNTAGTQPAPNTGFSDIIPYVRPLFAFPGFKGSDSVKIMTKFLGNNTYRITLEVLSTSKTPLSPGVYWVVHKADRAWKPFAVNHRLPDNGLESLAEDGNNVPLAEYLQGL